MNNSIKSGQLPKLDWLKNNITDIKFNNLMKNYYKKRVNYEIAVYDWLEKNYSN